MISLLEAYKAGLFRKGELIPNVTAGLIVGVVALPLAMAFAIASGARPEHGIYTAIIAGFVVSTLGGSRVQIAGPTGAFVAILYSVTIHFGIDGLRLATLMAGLILIVMGVARLGSVIRYIPSPVVLGFTTGIGFIIWVGQWNDFLGLPKAAGEHFHERFAGTLELLPQFRPAALGLGLFSLLLIWGSKYVKGLRWMPGPLAALVCATLLQWGCHFDGVATVGSAFGGIPAGLPQFAPPKLTPALLIQLIGPAFTIAMLGAIESLLSATVADGMAGTQHDANQELIGQGIANVIVPLFGGFAATGAIARTATSVKHGGSSPLAGIVHVLLLTATLLFLAPLAMHIPLTTLAAILFVVAYNMSELSRFKYVVLHAPKADVVILLTTFTLTVTVDLVVAINIGVIVAVFHFMRRMIEAVEVQHLSQADLRFDLDELGWQSLPHGLLVYEVAGPLFFGAVQTFEHALLRLQDAQGVLVLRLRHVPFMDLTALDSLAEVIEELRAKGIRVILCEANHRVVTKLWKAKILSAPAEQRYFQDFHQALAAAAALLSPRTVADDASAISRWLAASRTYFGQRGRTG